MKLYFNMEHKPLLICYHNRIMKKAGTNGKDINFSQAMKVGIVGAGISGVVAGAHLKAAGIDITVFERSSQAGGIW